MAEPVASQHFASSEKRFDPRQSDVEGGRIMAGRGVYFALSEAQAEQLSQAEGDDQVREIVDQIEEEWDRDWLFETDKAWDALHRTLTDGHLHYENGSYPLNLVVIGGMHLTCLLYTSPSPRDLSTSRMPSSA